MTLKDPQEAEGVKSAVIGLDGVAGIKDQREQLEPVFGIIDALKYGSWIGSGLLLLASLLLVANTIRLAAMARRREIGIMRLVGASTLYIALPFLLESLVTAVIGVGSHGRCAGGVREVRDHGRARGCDRVRALDRVGRLRRGARRHRARPGIVILGPALTLIPTLLLTRKYIKV